MENQEAEMAEPTQGVEQVNPGRTTESDRRELVKIGRVSRKHIPPLSRIGCTFRVRGWLYGVYNNNPKKGKFFARILEVGEDGQGLKANENIMAGGWAYQVYEVRTRGRFFLKALGIIMKDDPVEKKTPESEVANG